MAELIYCVTETPDEMTRTALYISALRLRTHVHGPFDGPCRQCLEDMADLGSYGFVLLTLLHDREREIEQLRAIITDLTDPDGCEFDHHGYCQAHAWLTEGECPHARAKKLLGGTR